MNILICCEESQRVCVEFRKLGHNAYSCDLQECSGGHPEWHIMDDALDLLYPVRDWFVTCDRKLHSMPDKWDMVIAHPPCTYLSKAGARWLFPKGKLDIERYLKGVAAREFFMAIWNCDCDCICIENPTPLKIFELPECSQVIQPYYFGEPFSKRTKLWIKGLPELKPTNVVKCIDTYCPSNTSNFSKGAGGSKGAARRSKEDCKERSRTFKGLAVAMAQQWG